MVVGLLNKKGTTSADCLLFFLETLHRTFRLHKGRKICEPPGDLGSRFNGLFLTFLPCHFILERRRRRRPGKRCFLWKAVDSSTRLIIFNIHRSPLTLVALLVLCLFRIIISRKDSEHLTSAIMSKPVLRFKLILVTPHEIL